MRPSGLRVLLALVCLAGCHDPRLFKVNGQKIRLSDAELADLRASWQPDPAAMAARTSTPIEDRQWILDTIALSERTGAGGLPRCDSLRLADVAAFGREPFAVKDGAATTTLRPTDYHEGWSVDACGTLHVWRVFDDDGAVQVMLTGRRK